MDLKLVEGAFVERLKERAGDFPTRPFPNNPALAGMTHKTGEYLVRYLGSTYGPAKATRSGAMEQVRTMQWEVTARNRNLSPALTNPGIYGMLEAANEALIKWTVPGVPGATVISAIRETFTDEVEGIWEYSQVVAFSFPEVTA